MTQNDGAPPPPDGWATPPADGSVPPPPPPAAFDPAQQWGAPPPKKRGFRLPGRLIGGVVVFGVLAAAGAVQNYLRDHKDPFTTPQTIGEGTLMTDADAQKVADDMRKNVENVHRAVSGVYAVNGEATFLIVAGDSDDNDAKGIYEEFKDSDADARIGPATPVGKVLCASMDDPESPGVACFWSSKKSDGILMHFGTRDVKVAGRLAQLAWDGVEA
ncbi:MAG TPA: hypothetical protein VF519_05290 [Mycobacteriales bacterium]|jgi:hypothetical protein